MSETNGDRDSRMDRVERALEMLLADHEQFRHDHKQLLIAQVLQKDTIDQLLKTTQEHSRQIPALDARVDQLVSSIGDFISRLPAR